MIYPLYTDGSRLILRLVDCSCQKIHFSPRATEERFAFHPPFRVLFTDVEGSTLHSLVDGVLLKDSFFTLSYLY
jgi:hypothetical protein